MICCPSAMGMYTQGSINIVYFLGKSNEARQFSGRSCVNDKVTRFSVRPLEAQSVNIKSLVIVMGMSIKYISTYIFVFLCLFHRFMQNITDLPSCNVDNMNHTFCSKKRLTNIPHCVFEGCFHDYSTYYRSAHISYTIVL
jgi:hypothetical protein